MEVKHGEDPLQTRKARLIRNLVAYVAINIVLWIGWWLTDNKLHERDSIPWPFWPMVGWALIIIYQFLVRAGKTNRHPLS